MTDDDTRSPSALPLVSVVVPMRNEAAHIGGCVEMLLAQEYPVERFEILVVDGASTDGSTEIVRRFGAQHPNLHLCDNPRGTTPHGMNEGIRRARGEVIVLVGSHTYVSRDFLRESVRALAASGGDAAGGLMEAIGHGPFGEAVAAAVSSRFGVGRIAFRQARDEGFVDTAAFAAYRRSVFERIGLFDEELVRDQDDELNYRLRKLGGRIFLTPRIRSRYVARATPRALWRQYFDYGLWKVRVFQKHPTAMQPRHFVPALSVAAGGTMLLGGLVAPPLLVVALTLASLYLATVGYAAVGIARRIGWNRLPHLLAVFPILHLSYGGGFLAGLVRFLPRWWTTEPPPPSLAPARGQAAG